MVVAFFLGRLVQLMHEAIEMESQSYGMEAYELYRAENEPNAPEFSFNMDRVTKRLWLKACRKGDVIFRVMWYTKSSANTHELPFFLSVTL